MYFIPTSAMESTILPGDLLLVNEIQKGNFILQIILLDGHKVTFKINNT